VLKAHFFQGIFEFDPHFFLCCSWHCSKGHRPSHE